ncbi:IS1380 family transposase [Streptomyces sp. NBC_01264]|uniref:IS1380 family transposase n=1 Tax=Streptomyces sp. NBC_01264 TaxID=2903804 RepID=UPI002256F4F0|nr:IS1380 family transposase [Streptomyces sp. NBC_01264]MCX4776899.1 IS1380 family transposase [Streptomyces sp. NBC_01264]MCX4784518.1 IS1380 family transposase [Streptomyces sp. NBC_01264]
MSELTEWSEGLSLSAGGRKLVGKAGIVPVRRLADKIGLTGALSGALVRRGFHPVHDRGGVLVSAACAVLLGARSIAGIAVMRQAALVLGRPASASTLYRTLDAIGPVQLAKITSARAKVRSRVHDLLDLRPGGFPWIRVDGRPLTGWSVLDVDASFVPAHSDKEGAEPHRKGFGLHPLLVFLDNTDEHLVCRLRPGSAGANTAEDHIEVSTEAVRQLPTRRRRKVLFRADGAGATKEWLAWITSGGGNKANTWEYSVGWSRDEDFWTGLAKVPEKAWTPALDAKGDPRQDAALVEITDLLGLSGWPPGLRIIIRREPVHPKYTKDLKPYEQTTGFRYTVIATNTVGRQLQWLDARHRAHAHVESGIRRSKALTLLRLPSFKFALNQAWCTLLALAMDLLSWLQLLALDGRLARAEPAAVRTDLLDVPAKLTDHARRRELKLDPAWPASHHVVAAWERVQALPDPG